MALQINEILQNIRSASSSSAQRQRDIASGMRGEGDLQTKIDALQTAQNNRIKNPRETANKFKELLIAGGGPAAAISFGVLSADADFADFVNSKIEDAKGAVEMEQDRVTASRLNAQAQSSIEAQVAKQGQRGDELALGQAKTVQQQRFDAGQKAADRASMEGIETRRIASAEKISSATRGSKVSDRYSALEFQIAELEAQVGGGVATVEGARDAETYSKDIDAMIGAAGSILPGISFDNNTDKIRSIIRGIEFVDNINDAKQIAASIDGVIDVKINEINKRIGAFALPFQKNNYIKERDAIEALKEEIAFSLASAITRRQAIDEPIQKQIEILRRSIN